MKVSRFLLLLAAIALVVGFVSADASQTPEQLVIADFSQSLVGPAPVCSSATGMLPPPGPDLCAECLAACHPRDFVCILACLNGPCI